MSLYLLLDVFIAFILDIFIGDPKWMPHPVKFINWLTKVMEECSRKLVNLFYNKKVTALGNEYVHSSARINRNEKLAGMYFMIIMATLITVIVFVIVAAAYMINTIAYHVISIYFMYSAFGTKTVAIKSVEVLDALKDRDIFKAGNILTEIVGRKIEHLDEQDIIRGTIETTAEDASEQAIAPIFYAMLGSLVGFGAPLVYLYKTINTLNNVNKVKGYTANQYKSFGWASSKLNTLFNYLPARIAGFLFVVAALLIRKDSKGSLSIMKRDKRKHTSPNSGYPEAAVAGALGIRLGGAGLYFGDIVDKPIIGDDTRLAEIRDISDTIKMMYAAATSAMVGFGLVFGLVFVVLQFI
jgi:adenosylcobinamide-phosphate synthase